MRFICGSAFVVFLAVAAAARLEAQTIAVALPPIQTVDYDEHAVFRVNGKPFFPILLYGGALDDAALARFREFGFNTLTCRPELAATLPPQGFYAAVHGGKQPVDPANVLLAMGIDSPALNYKQDLFARTAESNAKAAAAVPGRPVMNAIGYWEDEPAGVVAGKLPSQEKYDDLVVAIDVAAPYLYPVPYQPIATVGDAVARARRATKGAKPILPILQLFAWEPTARYPTVAELRCMTFLALVEGASGIGYYSYGSVTGHPRQTIAEVQPELWQSVRQLNREVAEFGPRLLGGNPANELTPPNSSSPLRMKAVRDADGLLVVIVNPTAEPVELDPAVIRILGGKSRLEPLEVYVASFPG